MKQYTYEKVSIDGFLLRGFTEHRDWIDRYAAEGYRYVGYIPTSINGHGVITEIDLIFERDLPAEEA